MPLRIKNGRWEYRFQLRGQKIRESTGLVATSRERKKAEQIEAMHRQAILEGRLGFHSPTPKPFNEAAHEFLAGEKATRKRNTFLRTKGSFSSALTFFGHEPVSSIHAGRIEAYKLWRLRGDARLAPVEQVTCRHDLHALSIFFQWAVRNRYARHNPTTDVPKPSDTDAVRIHIVTPEEEARYFTASRGTLHDVAKLILEQGLRPDEALSLEKTDVDLENGCLYVRAGKTKSARRRLKLTAEAQAILSERIQNHPGPWVFPNRIDPRRHVQKLGLAHDRVCTKTGLGFVLYDFRHTFATRHCTEKGTDLATLAALLGHSGLRSVQKYIHPTQAAQDKAMERYSENIHCRVVVDDFRKPSLP